jgi:hypothetical protein
MSETEPANDSLMRMGHQGIWARTVYGAVHPKSALPVAISYQGEWVIRFDVGYELI